MARNEEVLEFDYGEPEERKTRRMGAVGYVRKALVDMGPKAVQFQALLLEKGEEALIEGPDEKGFYKIDPALTFKASESILDRLMGKAAQEVRVADSEGRPLVFDGRLAALREGMKAAVDAAVREPGIDPVKALEDAAGEAVCRAHNDQGRYSL